MLIEGERALNAAMNSWQQRGRVFLWRYTSNQRNYPDFHLTADRSGVASLAALYELFATAEAGDTRTVAITAPTESELAVPNNRGAGFVAPVRLRISLHDDPEHWQLDEVAETASFFVGRHWLARLRDATTGIAKGQGDFSIGNASATSAALWFWWRLKAD